MNPKNQFELHWPGLERCVVLDMGARYYLVRLIVKAEWRGIGIGSAVIRQLQQKGLPVEVNPIADKAEHQADLDRFYYRLGFHPVQNYNRSGEWDNLIWKPSYKKPCPCDII